MHLYLPSKKLENIRKECKSVRTQGHITVRRLAHLIGLSISTMPAVLPAPPHYQALQCLKGKALRNIRHNYNTVISLDKDAVIKGSKLVDCSGIRIQWQTYQTPKGRENNK